MNWVTRLVEFIDELDPHRLLAVAGTLLAADNVLAISSDGSLSQITLEQVKTPQNWLAVAAFLLFLGIVRMGLDVGVAASLLLLLSITDRLGGLLNGILQTDQRDRRLPPDWISISDARKHALRSGNGAFLAEVKEWESRAKRSEKSSRKYRSDGFFLCLMCVCNLWSGGGLVRLWGWTQALPGIYRYPLLASSVLFLFQIIRAQWRGFAIGFVPERWFMPDYLGLRPKSPSRLGDPDIAARPHGAEGR